MKTVLGLILFVMFNSASAFAVENINLKTFYCDGVAEIFDGALLVGSAESVNLVDNESGEKNYVLVSQVVHPSAQPEIIGVFTLVSQNSFEKIYELKGQHTYLKVSTNDESAPLKLLHATAMAKAICSVR